MRTVAKLGHVRDHLGTYAVQKAKALVTDRHRLHRHASSLQFAQFVGDASEHVGIEAATKTFVGRHHNHSRCARRVGLHERVHVFGVGFAEVGRNIAHLLCVGPGSPHPFLRFTHLGDRYHLHGLGDLLRTFEVFDLAAYFLACCH